MEKIKIKLFSYRVLVIALGIIMVGSFALAFSGTITEKKVIVDDQVIKNEINITDETAINSEESNPDMGAVSSANIFSPFLCVNQVCKWYYSEIGKFSTTTPFAFKSPNATTTIESLTHVLYKADGVANYYDYATSTSAYASTSPFSSLTASANTLYTQTYLEKVNGSVVFPNTWIVVKAASADVASSTLKLILRESRNERNN